MTLRIKENDMKTSADMIAAPGAAFTDDSARKPILPVLALLAAVLLWGASYPAMKVVVQALGPWAVMWARMAIALAIIAPFAPRLKPRAYRRGDWWLLLPMAISMPCLYFLFEANALRFTSAAQAGVISSSVPLLVAVGARIFLAEALSATTAAGLALAIGGVAWLTLAGSPSESASNPLLGNALELCAMVCAAASMLLLKRLSERWSSWTLTAVQTLCGFLFFLPGAPLVLSAELLEQGWPVLLTLAFLGSCVTLGAFGLYNWGMSRLPASQASAFINLVPVTAVFLGWLLLGETLNAYQLLASACVLAGVWLSQGGVRKAD
ncbi:DMT family transporter [Desulfocurvibacter africanus]|uniref:DMT family transporter n=1 Tax=Desulfocurvibacter africanus TaxID=873 RepID=UPI00040A8321|nr:DMT family transporter [Desulfocurvibacter africanus]